jgi:cytochrome c
MRKAFLRIALIRAACAFTIVSPGASAWAQDVDAGERSFRKCSVCHAIGPDALNKVGPALNGLDGRTSGTIEGYNYTEANKNAGIVWSEATFKDYIADPRAKIPSTKMIFPGIKDAQESQRFVGLSQAVRARRRSPQIGRNFARMTSS